MSDSTARVQRATALEEKRRRLEDLKKRREVRGQDTARVQASATANLDDYIDGLLKEPGATEDGKEQPNNTKSVSVDEQDAASRPTTNGDGAAVQSTPSNVVAMPAPAPPPKVVETFTVSTQTDDSESPEVEEPEDEEDGGALRNDVLNAPLTADERYPKILSSEEVEKELASRPFSSFINTASKKVERMLGTPQLSDLLVDYVGEIDNAKGVHDSTKDANDKYLQSRQVYECSKWTSGRDVTDMDWSPLHRELLLSTYHMPMSSNCLPVKGQTAVSAVSPNDTLSSSMTPRSGELQSDGLALIWSLSMPNRPEHIFTCGSPVTAGRFHPTDATLIVGGCESGQLVVWDVRSGRLPVQKSALTTVAGASSKGHTHAIGSMEIIEGGVSAALL